MQAPAARDCLGDARRRDPSATRTTLPPVTVQLVGPGDITGIDPQQVIRTEPRAGVSDFEPNYLAAIDFYDEDFPWRYSPLAPDGATHRLPPWIVLIVLKDARVHAHATARIGRCRRSC